MYYYQNKLATSNSQVLIIQMTTRMTEYHWHWKLKSQNIKTGKEDSHSDQAQNYFLIWRKDFFRVWYVYFNWRLIGLQYCVGFCHTSTWIRNKNTFVLSVLNLHSTSHPILPFELSQNTEFEPHTSYSKFTRTIWFYLW